MSLNRNRNFKFDWITIILFLLLISFGWINILSASAQGEVLSYLDMSTPYGKQLVFILFTVLLIIVVLSIEAKFYERFASIIYLISIMSLLGLFIFGKTVNGATSWYGIGGFTLQPSEFAKFATALAVAKYISDLQTNIKNIKDQLKTALIIFIPAFLILLQNDAGSTLVYAAFFFVFYREGVPQLYLMLVLSVLTLSISVLKFSVISVCIVVTLIVFLHHFFIKKNKSSLYKPFLISLSCLIFNFGVHLFYNNILQTHQQNRISLWLRLEKDPEKLQKMKRTISYNLNESEKAISSGGFSGKGFLEGTRTIGKFVPEQHTDYIFSTVGEEWGFLGSSTVVILFIFLILRVLYLSELQKSQFSRVYGYSVASILFFHFMINIGMVMGLIPTVGIPLPFFSYGGSGLWGFTILLFVFIKLDANRINEW
jgi:rod shape determining protein RodA